MALFLDLGFRFFSYTYLTCFVSLVISEYSPYIDQAGKLILVFLGVSAGVLMRKSAKLKVKQAENELETSRLKLEEEKLKQSRDVHPPDSDSDFPEKAE